MPNERGNTTVDNTVTYHVFLPWHCIIIVYYIIWVLSTIKECKITHQTIIVHPVKNINSSIHPYIIKTTKVSTLRQSFVIEVLNLHFVTMIRNFKIKDTMNNQ